MRFIIKQKIKILLLISQAGTAYQSNALIFITALLGYAGEAIELP
jgi:hypothetical protein